MNAYASRTQQPHGLPPVWVNIFLVVQFVCIGALVVERLGSFRFGFRIMTFVSSLLMLGAMITLPSPQMRGYPVRTIAVAYLCMLAMGFIHPELNTPLAGIAHIFLNLAIIAPVFWVPRFAIDAKALRRIILLIWGFYTLSATVGVLQVYFPDRFMPDPSFVRQLVGEDVAESLKIQLDNGQSQFRPMGLSDSPGGAGSAGLAAFVTGLALAVTDKNILIRALGFAGAAIGIFCVYISQVRTMLIVAGADLVVFMALTALRGKFDRAVGLLIAGVLTISLGFVWVMTIGSNAVGARLETLTDESTLTVYQQNRGYFLTETFERYLPEYPLGAGLGRYGMMFSYFGDRSNPFSPPIYAEIQWTAWVFDGGFPLLLLGLGGVLAAVYFAAKTALTSNDPVLTDMATIITTLHLGVFVQTFGNIPFSGQGGLTFWLLNAALFTASRYRRPITQRPIPMARRAW